MQFHRRTLPIILLFLWSGSFRSTKCLRIGPEINYEDIKSVEATCNGLDSCKVPRTNEAWKYNCNCDSSCSFTGTCCVDSEYRGKYKQKDLKNLECRKLNNNRRFFYPWVRNCNPDLLPSKTLEELCTNKFLIYNQSDPFLDIPVTDPVTGITYQNYYCFACNENSGEERLVSWDIAIGGNLKRINKSDTIPNLNHVMKPFSWYWVVDNDSNAVVSLWPSIPKQLENALPFCYGFEIVSECALNYTNEIIKEKCLAYMALTRIRNGTDYSFLRNNTQYSYYRNPHCAICNYANMDGMDCVAEKEFPKRVPRGLSPSGDFFVSSFSLNNQTVKCREKTVYDPFAKKCRNKHRARRSQ